MSNVSAAPRLLRLRRGGRITVQTNPSEIGMETSLSLLDRVRQRSDSESWRRLVAVYTPVLRGWLRRYDVIGDADADDLVQDVLIAVAKELPTFQHGPGNGAFRCWLRTILVNRLRHYWRARQHRPIAIGGSDFAAQLEQLSDGQSRVSQFWDQEHDRVVIERLLDLVKPRFAVGTWEAFRRQMIDGLSAEVVATQLTMPLHSVYAAKSRVLKALREEAAGLLT